MKTDFSRKRWWDFPAIFLLIATLLTGATRLSASSWIIYDPIWNLNHSLAIGNNNER
jgi:hypothetical protein